MKINKWLIGGVALVAGAIAGSGVTYLIMHKREKDKLDNYCADCDAAYDIQLVDLASQQDASFSEKYRIFIESAKSIVEASSDLKNDSGEVNEVKNEPEPIIAPFMVNPNVPVDSVRSYSTALQNESTATTPYISPAEDQAYLEFMEAKKRERAERIKKKFMQYDKIDRMYEDGGVLEEPNTKNVEKEVDEVQLQIDNYQPEKPVHIITPEQFANECWGYEKTTLQWWKRNNLMSTEDFEIVDIPDLLGTEWIDRIGEFEPNIVYVRNDDSGTDYEIIATEDNFYDFNAG